MGWSRIFAFMEYGESWKQHRTLFQREFHPNVATPLFQPQLTKHTKRLLTCLLESPENFMHHISRYVCSPLSQSVPQLLRQCSTTTSVGMDVSYAIDISAKDDPYVFIAENALAGLNSASLHGAFLVEAIPLLRYIPAWFPGAGFQKKAREWKYYATKMFSEPFDVVKERTACTAICWLFCFAD